MLLLMPGYVAEGITLTMRCALNAQLCPVYARIMHRSHNFELDQNGPHVFHCHKSIDDGSSLSNDPEQVSDTGEKVADRGRVQHA